MQNKLTKKQNITIFVTILLFLSLVAGLILVSRSQEIRKKAGGGGASSVTLGFYPAEDQIKVGETKVYELKAFFTDGSPNERLSHVKVELTFPKKDKTKQYVLLPASDYINTSMSGFGVISRVDGPQIQNLTAKVIIDLLAKPDSGPTTDKALTIARFSLQGTNPTAISQYVTLGNIIFTSQNSVNPINPVTQNLKLDVLGGSCLQPIDCAAPPPNCNYQGGDGCTTCGTLVCLTPTSSVTPIPSITCIPRPPCLDAIPSCKLAEPSGGWCLQNPTPTPTIPVASCINIPTVDPFNQNTLDQNKWQVWNSINGQVNPDSNGLQTAVTNGLSGYAGVLTQNYACGDYDISVDFSGFTTSNVSEAEARLSLEDPDTNSTGFIGRYSLDNEQGFWSKVVVNGEEKQSLTVKKPTTVTAGKLRIRRIGDVFTTYYDEGAGWQKLGELNFTFRRNAKIGVLVKSWNQNPVVSATFRNFQITDPIMDITPSVTPPDVGPSGIVTPPPYITPIVTPPSGRDKYVIDVGTKQWLSINIGPAITPQIRFKAKIARVFNTPDMYFKLRVKDDLAFTTNGNQSSTDTCNNPSAGTTDYYIPVKADSNGVYTAVPQNNATAPVDKKIASVSSDGWVFLDGIAPGKYYSLYLKGPKTVGSRMVAHVILQPNQNAQVQDFDWIVTPLQAGDLPDSNNNGQQDCTVNSVDMSLIQSLLGKTDKANLDIADVNYDGVVQGSDLASVVITLSSKPDDDN